MVRLRKAFKSVNLGMDDDVIKKLETNGIEEVIDEEPRVTNDVFRAV